MVLFKDIRFGGSVDQQSPPLIKVNSHTDDFNGLSI